LPTSFKAATLLADLEIFLAMPQKKRRRWKVTQYTQPAMKSQGQVGENVEK
jgi:hypothetical protein